MRDVIVGDQLDQYDLTDLLARSGMASIFKAVDRGTGTTVALKIPYMQFESDLVFHERFRREEDIGKRLEHPNIVRVLTPDNKSRMYLVMEYIEGTSLRALIEREAPLPEERALVIARQICEALVYMHSKGVVHRDLKPENILVLPDGQVKILDFGIAMDEAARRLTWAGLSSTIGTPDYMAPEQIGGRRGDVRTDVYALGTILYEMLTGELPFSAANAHAMMRAKTSADPDVPTKHAPNLSPSLEEILLHAIARSPRERYKSAAEFLEDLRDPSRVTPGSRTSDSGGSNLRVPRGAAFAVVVVAVLSLLGGLIWLSTTRVPKTGAPHKTYRGELK